MKTVIYCNYYNINIQYDLLNINTKTSLPVTIRGRNYVGSLNASPEHDDVIMLTTEALNAQTGRE